MVDFMVSNDGPHSAEQWADITTQQIIRIEPDAAGDGVTAGVKFKEAITSILIAAHKRVQVSERTELEVDGDKRLEAPLDPREHIDPTLQKIVGASTGTPFETHFKQYHVLNYVTNVLGQHFATSMDIERKWYKDRKQTQAGAN
jgi:hypothetical protein